MFKRFMFLFVLLSVLVAPSLAQDSLTLEPYCGDLSDADCAIITDLSGSPIESADFNLTLDFALKDPQDQLLNASLALLVDGSFEIDFMAFEGISQELTQFTTIETAGELIDLLAVYGDVFRTSNADVNLQVFESMSQTNLLGRPQALFDMDLMLVDGIGYADMDDLSEFFPDAPSGWHGTSVPAAMLYLGTMVAAFLPRDSSLSELGVDTGSLQVQAYDEAETAEIIALIDEFGTLTRIADRDLGDEMGAVFLMTFDFSGVEIPDSLLDEMEAQLRQQNPTMSAREINQIMDMMPIILNDLQISYTATVGLESRVTRALDMQIYIEDLHEAMSVLDPTITQHPSLRIGFTLDYTHINNIDPIVAPSDATTYPAPTLFFGLMGQLGQ